MANSSTEKKPGIVARVTRSVKDMAGEMTRVVWPTRKQTINNTVIVIAFMLVMAVVIGSFDLGLSSLVKLVFGAKT